MANLSLTNIVSKSSLSSSFVNGIFSEIEDWLNGVTASADITLTGTLQANVVSDGTGSFTGGVATGFSSITSTNFAGNLTGNVTGNITGDLTGTLQTAAQPNITSLGTLTGLTTSGDITCVSDLTVGNTSSVDYSLSIFSHTDNKARIYFKAQDSGNRLYIESDLDVSTSLDTLTFKNLAADDLLKIQSNGVVSIPSGFLTLDHEKAIYSNYGYGSGSAGFRQEGANLADDSVYSFTIPSSNFFFMFTSGNAQYGYGFCVNGVFIKGGGSTDLDVTTGALTGTTGTDGHQTLSTDSGTAYMENRHGSTRPMVMHIFYAG